VVRLGIVRLGIVRLGRRFRRGGDSAGGDGAVTGAGAGPAATASIGVRPGNGPQPKTYARIANPPIPRRARISAVARPRATGSSLPSLPSPGAPVRAMPPVAAVGSAVASAVGSAVGSGVGVAGGARRARQSSSLNPTASVYG
jgi:hypothetical protein